MMATGASWDKKTSSFLQVYEGLVYMDFSKHLFETQGYGNNMFDIFKVEMQIFSHYEHWWSKWPKFLIKNGAFAKERFSCTCRLSCQLF